MGSWWLRFGPHQRLNDSIHNRLDRPKQTHKQTNGQTPNKLQYVLKLPQQHVILFKKPFLFSFFFFFLRSLSCHSLPGAALWIMHQFNKARINSTFNSRGDAKKREQYKRKMGRWGITQLLTIWQKLLLFLYFASYISCLGYSPTSHWEPSWIGMWTKYQSGYEK